MRKAYHGMLLKDTHAGQIVVQNQDWAYSRMTIFSILAIIYNPGSGVFLHQFGVYRHQIGAFRHQIDAQWSKFGAEVSQSHEHQSGVKIPQTRGCIWLLKLRKSSFSSILNLGSEPDYGV